MEDVYAIIGIAGVLSFVGGFFFLVYKRWGRGAPTRQRIGVQRSANVDDATWRQRLGRLNNLLSRIQAADTDRDSLGTEIADRLRDYLGDGTIPRSIPSDPNQMLDDIVLAERILGEVQIACRLRSALPGSMALEVDHYLNPQRRLEP